MIFIFWELCSIWKNGTLIPLLLETLIRYLDSGLDYILYVIIYVHVIYGMV